MIEVLHSNGRWVGISVNNEKSMIRPTDLWLFIITVSIRNLRKTTFCLKATSDYRLTSFRKRTAATLTLFDIKIYFL